MTREEIIRNLKYTMEKHKNDTVNTFDTNISVMCKDILDYLEQEPCEDAISRQNDILPNIDKEVESYKKLLKHPVVKHIIGLNEEQEQLDFVQPHKRIPVTLTVSDDLISRETVCDYIAEFINHEYSTQSECEMVDSMIEGIQHMPSVKPQEPCDVSDTNIGKMSENPTGSEKVGDKE